MCCVSSVTRFRCSVKPPLEVVIPLRHPPPSTRLQPTLFPTFTSPRPRTSLLRSWTTVFVPAECLRTVPCPLWGHTEAKPPDAAPIRVLGHPSHTSHHSPRVPASVLVHGVRSGGMSSDSALPLVGSQRPSRGRSTYPGPVSSVAHDSVLARMCLPQLRHAAY